MDKTRVCPNCGYEAKSDQDPLITAYDGMGECPACGIIVAKYGQRPSETPNLVNIKQHSPKKGSYLKWGALIVAAAFAAVIYWKFPPMALVGPGDPAFGAISESAGGNLNNYTAHSKGKFIRVHSHAARWHWRAKTARQARVFSLSRTGQYLATAALPGKIKIWEKSLFWYSPVCTIQGSITTPSAMTFDYDGTAIVIMGDHDRKLEIHNIAQQKCVARFVLEEGDLPCFCLRVSPERDIHLSEAQLAYVREGSGYGDIYRLQDRISGAFVKNCNDGWKARFEPAKTLSWNFNGRYTAYAEKDGVWIWKLCPSRTCRFGRQE